MIREEKCKGSEGRERRLCSKNTGFLPRPVGGVCGTETQSDGRQATEAHLSIRSQHFF